MNSITRIQINRKNNLNTLKLPRKKPGHIGISTTQKPPILYDELGATEK